MAMKVSTFNGVKVYNLSNGKSFPTWLSENQKRKLAKDDEYRNRVDLIQDFEVNTAAQRVRLSGDGEHVLVSGTYPPCFRCYTLSDLSLKFHRGLNAEVVDMASLSDDYQKVALLLNDRNINIHAAYGTHYSTRIPKFGRDLKYSWNNCDLLVASSSDEIYRLNLDSGQFKEPFKTSLTACNKLHINPQHQLLGCGGTQATCEFWDARYRKSVCVFKVDQNEDVEVTALKFDVDGLTLGVGTSDGNCILYDIRSSKPLYKKEHQYELPIVDISFHAGSKQVISTDKKVIKIWDRNSANMGKILTNIETPCDINDICMVDDKRGSTGMFFVAGEQKRLMTYFIPQMGPAPQWSSFLENITEELEESSVKQTVYEDYKFLTEAEVKEIGAGGLIGTPMLKGYMHGYFIDMKLYNELRAVSNPFDYDIHRKKKIQEKIAAKAESHIGPRVRVKKLKEKQEKALSSAGMAVDDRFKALFERDDFEIDEGAMEYKLHNPTASNRNRNRNDDDDDDDEENDNLRSTTNRKDNNSGSGRFAGDSDDDGDDDDDVSDTDFYSEVVPSNNSRKGDKSSNSKTNSSKTSKDSNSSRNGKKTMGASGVDGPKLYESNTSISKLLGMSQSDKKSFAEQQKLSLQDRVDDINSKRPTVSITKFANKRDGQGLQREISFVPKGDVRSSSSSSKDKGRGRGRDSEQSGASSSGPDRLKRGKRNREEDEIFATMNSK